MIEPRESGGQVDCDCPKCAGLEARVAELEARLAEAGDEAEGRGPTPAPPPLAFRALRITDQGWGAGWALRPSPARRNWMNEQPYAYQCLPLVVANQWGWQVLCPTDVTVTWSGDRTPAGLTVEVDPRWSYAVKSQFGEGIVTFSPPWLFRTSPGWDLLLKGPGNRWKVNCVALEGVIETWWLNYTFTINWKVVEPGVVTFARGESLGQLVPIPHATFRDATAVEGPIEHLEPEAAAEMMRWREERRKRADLPVSTHKLYRKAENVDDHLIKVPVPPVVWTDPNSGPNPGPG